MDDREFYELCCKLWSNYSSLERLKFAYRRETGRSWSPEPTHEQKPKGESKMPGNIIEINREMKWYIGDSRLGRVTDYIDNHGSRIVECPNCGEDITEDLKGKGGLNGLNTTGH